MRIYLVGIPRRKGHSIQSIVRPGLVILAEAPHPRSDSSWPKRRRPLLARQGQGRTPHRHVVRLGQPDGPAGERGNTMGSMTMSETCAVKDLAIGKLIQVDGFDGDVTVRSARRITKGLDAGKLQVALVTANVRL